jgi:hypothetical protein
MPVVVGLHFIHTGEEANAYHDAGLALVVSDEVAEVGLVLGLGFATEIVGISIVYTPNRNRHTSWYRRHRGFDRNRQAEQYTDPFHRNQSSC